FIYATIRDPHTRDTIDARIPVHLAAQLPWNQEAVFVGLLHLKGRRGELRPEFRVDAIHEAGTLRLPSKAELLERWAAAAARPRRDVRAALAQLSRLASLDLRGCRIGEAAPAPGSGRLTCAGSS